MAMFKQVKFGLEMVVIIGKDITSTASWSWFNEIYPFSRDVSSLTRSPETSFRGKAGVIQASKP